MEGDCTKTLLITANIASIFEEPDTLFPIWLKAFYQSIQTHKPGFLAIHCQEVGGKNYEESMQYVNHFIKTLLGCEELHRYDRARIFLDEDYTASDKFTAMGNIYFIHEEVMDVLIWDFVDCMFIEVEGREVLSGNIENVPIKEKAKFPQYFFPEFKWSRKGFMRTRWSINNCIFDLINIHLFHDASNIVAMESSPSIYSNNRQRAFVHTLQRFENDKYSKVPFFIFGDFNFRLDANKLIQELTQKLVSNQIKGKKDQVKKIEYTEEGNGKAVLTIESKFFDYYDKHTDLFANMGKWVHQFDNELSQYRDRLFEYDVSFPPSYPFCEGLSDGISYMKTRVPAWCDRILLSHSGKDILSQDPSHKGEYNIIGKGVCMGDHKPVYLFVHMKPGKGNLEKQVSQEISPAPRSTSSSTSEQIRPRTLSINGEPINFSASKVDFAAVNIHDYAVFEKEQDLIPEFRASIKSRNSEEIQTDGGGSHHPSAREAVKKVIAMEKVLLKWPTNRRSRTRHHSSSSEDLKSDDDSESGASSHKSDANNTQKNSPKIADENEISVSLNEANNNKINNNDTKSSKKNNAGCVSEGGDTGKGLSRTVPEVNVFGGSDTRGVSHVACHPSSSSSSPPSSANPEEKGKPDTQSTGMSSNQLTQTHASPPPKTETEMQQEQASSNPPTGRCCAGCVLL